MTYRIIPTPHKLGGSDSPYEKYHLDSTWAAVATRPASDTQSGFAPHAILSNIRYVDVPEGPDSEGTVGERALDDDWEYFCIAVDTWRRVPLLDI